MALDKIGVRNKLVNHTCISSHFTNYVSNGNQYSPKCQLLLEEEGPLPVIFMALGRSGSSITWHTVAGMTGYPNTAHEITGGRKETAIAFFNNIDPDVGSHWASEKVCEIQHHHVKKMKKKGIGIAGFQWKPLPPTLRHGFGDGALTDIAAHSHPSIKVIYLARNPLDRLLSNRKHANYQHLENISAHCSVGDDECVRQHKQHGRIFLPVGRELKRSLESGLRLDRIVEDKLAYHGVKHVHVTYDKLYKSNDAKEWLCIFRFLGRGPQEGLTMENVTAYFDLAPTSSRCHNETIANFDEVWDTLKGTKYEYLVH